MKILHVTPHLGGGVGKAHSEVCAATGQDIRRTFALLEEPRDRRFSNRIEASSASVLFVPDVQDLQTLAADADIVQFEFWNHPKIFEALAMSRFPAMRSLFWCHISGLFAPYIAPGLLTAANRFVFTSPCSLQSPAVEALTPADQARLSVIGSGFGFGNASLPKPRTNPALKISYLGTVDFAKMHPDFFQMVDAVVGPEFTISVWGGFDPDGDVAKAHNQMKHPERVELKGHCTDPESAMRDVDLFLYPLQPYHYGTAENALIEAMSAGAAPLVLANPAECAIVDDGVTGFIATTMRDCSSLLGRLLADPDHVRQTGYNAAVLAQSRNVPRRSADQFRDLYTQILEEPKTDADFEPVIGKTPLDWFLSTQAAEGAKASFVTSKAASKGSVSHFLASFPDDPGLLSLL